MTTGITTRCSRCGAQLPGPEVSCPACTGHDEHVGRTLLGKYRCVSLLAVGAKSRVYKVQHAKLHQFRTLKILRPEYREDTRVVEAFWREARIAATLRQPNLVILHDVDALADATPVSVWEFVEGQTLAERVAQAPLGPATAEAARGLLAALEALHRRGLAHLDLCPENVLLAEEDDTQATRLINLGEARPFGTASERTGRVRIGYCAPEQLTGEPVSARADVFAVGALLCLAYTGKPPLASPSVEAYAHALKGLDPLRLKVVEELPLALRLVVARCLEPRPEARPADAAAVREAIRRAARELTGDQGPARPLEAAAPPAMAQPAREPAAPTREHRVPDRLRPLPGHDDEPPTLPTHEAAARPQRVFVPEPERPPQPTAGAQTNRMLAPPSLRIEFLAGVDREPTRITGEATLGRGEGNSLLLINPTVSKRHGRIRFDGAIYVYEDLGSRNGSILNDLRVTGPVPLQDGDLLCLGEVALRIRLR